MAIDESATSVSQTMFRYDVFLSFRGEDTRHGFTGYLYQALCGAGINTFMDDEELRVGEEIRPALLRSIEESKIAIIVFSENYADSSWCLDEFAKIIQCHKENSQIVFPIFYKVNPSDVRYQRNSYGRAMTKHETKFGVESEKVTKWKSSFAEVASLKGYHFRGYQYEYKMIQEIVSEASNKVSSRSLDINEHIVGLKDTVEELKSILEIESKDTTFFLGIHGTGGIGKTTLAKALYNSICYRFESSCFLFNVRETSEQYEGQKLLLQRLLTEMFNEQTIHLASVDKGTKTTKRELGKKRVLLVIDDVDDIMQLRTLAGERNWFGRGSRIIITTRDKELLDVHHVEKIYKMEMLNDHDSMKLFCQNVFKMNCPTTNYEELSNRVVHYAKGLPLALKVLGSHLIGKDLGEWKSALDKYEKSPHKDIQSILRISYDGLERDEKSIFLDIACFFKGQRMEYVKTILEACDFFPGIGIKILVDRSLMTVEHGCLMMHDLIQGMGREIVKEDNPRNAGKRSRLWFHEDVLEVLTEYTGTEKIEGILLDPPQRLEIEWIDTAFEKMKNLRILIIRNTSFSSAPSYLPNKLRLLDWIEYPSQSFPSRFNCNKIVAFNLRGSLLVQPFQAFDKLTYMNVSNCNFVTQIPNVSGAKNLRELKLDGCEKLVIVDESVGFLPNLVYLSASRCIQLQSFVSGIWLPSLEYLSFNLCRRLEHFPEIMGIMDKPLKIHLIDTSIEELPHSICNLTGLEYLEMKNCNRLRYLPACIHESISLTSLDVSECMRLEEIPQLWSSVQKVNARHCNSLNAKTLDMLWLQVRKEVNRLEVIMPRSEIPRWFDHCKEDGILFFRACGKFPVVVVAFVFEKLEYMEGRIPSHWDTVRLQLFIEGEQVHCKQNQTFYVADNHVLVCDLRVMFNDEEWEGLNARLGHDDNNWKTVQVACETSMTLSCCGVYVYEEETNIDDIQFNTSPHHSHPSFSTVHHHGRLFETSEEDINDHIVGLEDPVEELKSILEIESKNTTCYLGIHGTSGIGKTTLAKALYNSICNQFEASFFLFNVRETSNQNEGKKLLLQTLLTKMLKEGTVHLASVNEGTKKMKKKLGKKRILLVLDDVDDIKQLDVLAGGRDWFGSGSRIIITTRDKHLLHVHQVEKIYEMKVLNDHDSKELFCQNAFKKSCPAPYYDEMSNCAVRYAKGLPLALKVLGSHLIGKNKSKWKSALDNCEKSPHKDIQSILRISYDGLESNEQNIFLDIACFFKGQRMEYVKTILDACDFFPGGGIRILVVRSLITVERGCLMMHDLIQGMGREIVKEEKPKDASKRSRLWFHEDVLEVLTKDTGSSKIEGIMLDPPQREEEIEWIDTAFKKMKNLRILIIRNTSFSSAPSYLPNQLRLLDWKEYPSQSFPSCFNPKKIVAFNLRGSLLVQPFQTFEHLTYMNVSNCNYVTQIPNVSGANSLRELKLDGCEKLVIVDESVGFLPNLVYLSASGCFQLQSFVSGICLPSLEYLSFNFCRSLEHFPEIVGMMDKPLKVYLRDTSIEELPHSIGNLIGLEYLEMTSCNKLRYLPSSLFMLPNLVTLKVGGCSRLPESFRRLQVSNSVRTLHFDCAGLSDEDLPMIIQSFPNLQDLNMLSNRFASFPACIKDSTSLTSLDVSNCNRLVEIPELPSSVQKVNARHCYSLNYETLGMLWFQVRKEITRLEVVMPRSREIPEWFAHGKVGGIPAFKARGKFPVVAVAFAFVKLNDKGTLPTHWETVRLQLFIEGEQVRRKHNQTFYVPENHALLCDLRVMFSDEEWKGLNARLGHDWKTVQVVCETKMRLSWWGVYVYKKETYKMDNIQFSTSQHHPMVHHQRRLVETIKEDKVRNTIEGINVPVMFEGFMKELRPREERGEFVNVGPRFNDSNQSLLRSLAKMSNWDKAQREGNNSGFNLEDEDDKEGESMPSQDHVANVASPSYVPQYHDEGLPSAGSDKGAATVTMGMNSPPQDVAADPSYHVPPPKYHEDGIIMGRQLYDELLQANMNMPSQDHVVNTTGPSSVPQYDDDDVVIVERQLYDELVQANMTMSSLYHDGEGIYPKHSSDIGETSGQSSQDDDVVKVQYYIFDFTKQ